MNEPVIVGGVRTPIGKALKGSLIHFRPDELAGMVMRGVLDRAPALPKAEVDDIVMGCAMPEAEQGMNVANIGKFIADIPNSVPAMTVNRLCSSGLQSLVLANDSIAVGRNQAVIAGGTESMTSVPLGGHKFSPHPGLIERMEGAFMNMGHTAERVADQYKVSRIDQDRFAFESHQKALKAQAEGKFTDQILPIRYEAASVENGNRRVTRTISLDRDEGPRADTTLEALAKLKPVFRKDGTVTAGNASQVSDGAAALLLMNIDKAKALGLAPVARLVAYAVAGVPPELMGIGPIEAIPKALKAAGLSLKDIGLIELNEAFASQSLAIIRELSLDPSIVNVNGGAIALGHPLGATGAILTVKLLSEMAKRKVRYGMVSMCIGGGMGAAGIFERF